MLNGKQVKTTAGGGDFATIPADKYTVQITDVNFKTQFSKFTNREEECLNYEFTILNDDKTVTVTGADGKEVQEALRGRKLWNMFAPNKDGEYSLGLKAGFGKLVMAAMGRELSEEEKKSFQPESIIDSQIDVLVEVNRGTGNNSDREFSNIRSFIKNSKPLIAFENDKAIVAEPKSSTPVDSTDGESTGDGFIAGLEADKSS